MAEFQVGDIVRMREGVAWVDKVLPYVGQPLLIDGFVFREPEIVNLSSLDGTVLCRSHDRAWTFNVGHLEPDPFLMAVRKRRHATR